MGNNKVQVVGRGGENLRKVREQCGVHVSMEREAVVHPTTFVQERLVTMTGDSAQIPYALWCVLAAGGETAAFGAAGHLPILGIPSRSVDQAGTASYLRGLTGWLEANRVH